jgi:hypothetical protein
MKDNSLYDVYRRTSNTGYLMMSKVIHMFSTGIQSLSIFN